MLRSIRLSQTREMIQVGLQDWILEWTRLDCEILDLTLWALSSSLTSLYSCTRAWIRCSLTFSLMQSSIQCTRGDCSAGHMALNKNSPPIDLNISEANDLNIFFNLCLTLCKSLSSKMHQLCYKILNNFKKNYFC